MDENISKSGFAFTYFSLNSSKFKSKQIGDKNGKTKKYSRDLDSDWVVQKDEPHYGLKEHAAVDTNHGFILVTTMTPASVNDTNYLPYCTVFSRHTKQKIEK